MWFSEDSHMFYFKFVIFVLCLFLTILFHKVDKIEVNQNQNIKFSKLKNLQYVVHLPLCVYESLKSEIFQILKI